MELRTYWSVVWRWRWLVLAITAATFAASLLVQPTEPTVYQATLRLAVRPNLEVKSDEYSPALHQYYEYVASEYLNDDIIEILKSPAFQRTVSERAAAKLGRPALGAIDARKAHRVLKIDVTSDDAAAAETLAHTIAELLVDPAAPYFPMLVSFNPTITVVDQVHVAQLVGPSRTMLFLVLRGLLGLLVGLGLAFLLEYLDESLRNAREVESVTGLAVLGEIPVGRGQRSAGRTVAGPEAGGRTRTA